MTDDYRPTTNDSRLALPTRDRAYFVGAQARSRVVNLRDGDQFVGAGAGDEGAELLAYGGRGADDCARLNVLQLEPVGGRQHERVVRRRKRTGITAAQVQEAFGGARPQMLRVLVGLGGNEVDPEHQVRLREIVRRLK